MLSSKNGCMAELEELYSEDQKSPALEAGLKSMSARIPGAVHSNIAPATPGIVVSTATEVSPGTSLVVPFSRGRYPGSMSSSAHSIPKPSSELPIVRHPRRRSEIAQAWRPR